MVSSLGSLAWWPPFTFPRGRRSCWSAFFWGRRMIGAKACRPVTHRLAATIPVTASDGLPLPLLDIRVLLQPLLLRTQHPGFPGAFPIAMGHPEVMMQKTFVLKMYIDVRGILLCSCLVLWGRFAGEVVRHEMAFGSGARVGRATISTHLV
jgi:hypothetical protein